MRKTERSPAGFVVRKFYFALLTLLLLSHVASPTLAQQSVGVALSKLRSNTKLLVPETILSEYDNGAREAAVIVHLRPTAAADDLAARSASKTLVPHEFARPGAPTYYNLQDEAIRTQLRSTIADSVGRVLDRAGKSGITVTQKFSYQFGFAAKVTPEALERLLSLPDVVSVEKDHILHAHLAQGIPLMAADTVRSVYTGYGTSIAICDTGIDTSHPRLGGGGFPNSKVIGGYDTGDNDADPRPNSTSGNAHGTACAGIAAGNTGTVGDYIGGVAPDAKLYAIKISTGTTGSATSSAMIAGWEWCITHKNDDPANPILVISTSFGGGQYFSNCDSASTGMTAAAANAVAAGITIFASSGNDGYCDSMGWPACISYVNSVGAVYDANFGTYYPCINALSCAPTKTATTSCSSGWYATDNSQPDVVTSYSNTADFLTLFAPSNRAYTTDIVGSGGYSSEDYTTSFGGTSAACPYAAGAAAVLQHAARLRTGSYLTPAQVQNYLTSYGEYITDGKVDVTKPRVNLERSILATTPTVERIGIFTNGAWYLDANGNGAWNGAPPDTFYANFAGGLAGAVPVTGGWLGGGASNAGAFVNGVWYLDLNGNGVWDGTPTDGLYSFGKGLAGALPVTGDWNGTGSTKIGVFHDGTWYLDLNGNGAWDGAPTDLFYVNFGAGLAGAVPVTGDWTGTGASKAGLFANGIWYIDLNGNGVWDGPPTDSLFYFGTGVTGCKPAVGKW